MKMQWQTLCTWVEIRKTFLGGPRDKLRWYSDGPADAEMVLKN